MRATYKTPVIDSEIFFYYTGTEVSKNIVLDVSSISADTSIDGTSRYILKAGTLLQKSSLGTVANPLYRKFNNTGKVEGVLALDVEVPSPAAGNTAAGMFFNNLNLDGSKIVDYSTYGTNAASTFKADGLNVQFLVP